MPPRGGRRASYVGKIVLEGSKIVVRVGYCDNSVQRGEPINLCLEDLKVLLQRNLRHIVGWRNKRLLKRLGFLEKEIVYTDRPTPEPEYVESQKMI